MNNLEVLSVIGTNAVKRLRDDKLASGIPFMINSKDLPRKQSYLEFPDRTIQIVTVSEDAHSFVTLKTLDASQADAVRQRYNLI
jgi:hypothetical protein